MRWLFTLTLALFMAPSAGNASQPTTDDKDALFLEQAAQSGMFEIQASQLALQSATHEAVKGYARLMLVQHEIIRGDLDKVAAKKNVTLAIDLEGKLQDSLTALQQLKGAQFDERYIEEVAIDAHEDAISLFTQAAKDSQDPDIKSFAERTLPSLQQHLDRARNIAREPGSKPSSETGDTKARPRDAGTGDADTLRKQRAEPGRSLPAGQAQPSGNEATRQGAPGTPEKAAETQ